MADYFETGFTVRERSLHGKEDVLADWPEDWDAARRFARIEREPEERQLAVQVKRCVSCVADLGHPHAADCHRAGLARWRAEQAGDTLTEAPLVLDDEADTAWEPVTSHKAIVRSDTGFHLGTVGQDWTPITHKVMGETVEAILDQPNVKIDTMIAMKEGRQVAATILLDEPYRSSLPSGSPISLAEARGCSFTASRTPSDWTRGKLGFGMSDSRLFARRASLAGLEYAISIYEQLPPIRCALRRGGLRG